LNFKKNLSIEMYATAALLLAWLGVWGAWIGHKTVALTQNAIDLAEWSDYLMDVRFGGLAGTPDRLRLAVGLAMIALALGAGAIGNWWLRWGMRLIAALPAVVMLPPYPFLLELWWSNSYGVRFTIALLALAGIAVSGLFDRLAGVVRQAAIAVLGTVSAVLGIWAFLALKPPFEAHYASSIAPGWGALLFWGGLILAVGFEVTAACRGRQTPSSGIKVST
jgi:hypothetical protein